VTYDLTLTDPTGAVNTDGMAVKDKPVIGGAIAQPVTIPANVTKPAGLAFTIIVHDAKGNRAQSAGRCQFPELPPAPLRRPPASHRLTDDAGHEDHDTCAVGCVNDGAPWVPSAAGGNWPLDPRRRKCLRFLDRFPA
jgi:hypothetical protein